MKIQLPRIMLKTTQISKIISEEERAIFDVGMDYGQEVALGKTSIEAHSEHS